MRSIKSGTHFDAPSFSRTVFVFPFLSRRAGPVMVEVKNSTGCRLRFYMDGPSPRQLIIAPGQSRTANVIEGKYDIGYDPRPCEDVYFPSYAEMVFSPGSPYKLELYQQDIVSGGDFVMRNDSADNITVRIGTVSRTMGRGETKFRVPLGPHTVVVTSPTCGTLERFLRVERHRVAGMVYSCVVTRDGVILR